MAKANYDLPEEKLKVVKDLTKAKSKREAIVIALDSYIQKKRQEEILSLEGKLKLDFRNSRMKNFRD